MNARIETVLKIASISLIALALSLCIVIQVSASDAPNPADGVTTLSRVLARLDIILAEGCVGQSIDLCAPPAELALAAIANALLQMIGAPNDEMHPLAEHFALYVIFAYHAS